MQGGIVIGRASVLQGKASGVQQAVDERERTYHG
jgi:hypothetical protein